MKPEATKISVEIAGGKQLSIETGKLAKQAGGSAVVRFGEDYVFAEAHDGRAAGLLGKFSSFNRELFSASDLDGNFCGFRLHKSSFVLGRRACARARSSREQADARRRLGAHFAKALGSGTSSTRSRLRSYLRMPSLEITVLYRSESYFFK